MFLMKKAHFIGICGAGMSGVAKLLKDKGWQISGSDENFYPPVSDFLEKNKIPFAVGYRPKNIPPDANLIVIGKHVRLVPEKNKEVKRAFEMGVPVKSFAEVLGELSEANENIIVAGSHGKSTCAALLAWCLERSGKNPNYFIGAVTKTPFENARTNKGKTFVIEGDEYPASNWDNKSKFLHYRPNYLLLTSLAHDHINVFRTANDYKKPFKKLISSLPKDGLIVACADGRGVKEIFNKTGKNVIFYGSKSNATWTARNVKFGNISSFEIFRGDKRQVAVKTTLLGSHNVENILGAAALLLTLKLISPKRLKKAILTFKALERRLDLKSENSRVPFYEGFGSSYFKAVSAIRAVREHFPNKKILVLFEPHAISWRHQDALPWYDKVFKNANRTLIYKPPKFGIANKKLLTLPIILKRVRRSGTPVEGFANVQKGLSLLKKYADSDTVILALSSGGFDGFIDKATNLLNKKFP